MALSRLKEHKVIKCIILQGVTHCPPTCLSHRGWSSLLSVCLHGGAPVGWTHYRPCLRSPAPVVNPPHNGRPGFAWLRKAPRLISTLTQNWSQEVMSVWSREYEREGEGEGNQMQGNEPVNGVERCTTRRRRPGGCCLIIMQGRAGEKQCCNIPQGSGHKVVVSVYKCVTDHSLDTSDSDSDDGFKLNWMYDYSGGRWRSVITFGINIYMCVYPEGTVDWWGHISSHSL